MEVQVANCRFGGALICKKLLLAHELHCEEKCKRSLCSGSLCQSRALQRRNLGGHDGEQRF
jgi:hypothetical protein